MSYCKDYNDVHIWRYKVVMYIFDDFQYLENFVLIVLTLLELIKDIQKHHNNALNITLLFVSIYDVC